MLTYLEMRTQLALLSSEAIAQIVRALHDLKDRTVERAAMDVIWARHGVSGDVAWPTRGEARVGDPLGFWGDLDPSEWRPPSVGLHTLISRCRKDPGPGIHQVGWMLDWTFEAPTAKDPHGDKFWGLECTCGHVHRSQHELRWRQEVARPGVWPTILHNGIWNYWVCQSSQVCDDVNHAPSPSGSNCLCGAELRYPPDCDDVEPQYRCKLLPVQ